MRVDGEKSLSLQGVGDILKYTLILKLLLINLFFENFSYWGGWLRHHPIMSCEWGNVGI
jgi:hypothetical protein